jgi:ribonucleoside-diphosphate reductase alpha chain
MPAKSKNIIPAKLSKKTNSSDKNIFLSQQRLNQLLEKNFSKNALTVIQKRYLLKDRKGRIKETPLDMLIRVADHVASAEKLFGADDLLVQKYRNIFLLMMLNCQFLPNSPTFTGSKTKLGQLAACFVLPIKDDMHEILKTQMDMGLIHKSGGGTGFSFSQLRPKDDIVGSTGGISCGPIGFMQMFNDTTEQIKQGGTRRGANMAILSIDHPDILEYINYKEKEGTLANFNISVAVTDKFMKALRKNEDYALINPRDKKIAKTLNAREVWNKIISAAWRNGEPGVIFIDTINRDNPTPHIFQIESTNPCGEQPLGPYESCNLGSINLDKFVIEKNNKLIIDWKHLDEIVKKAIRFMDNVVEINKYPIPEIEQATKFGNRKLGLGVMGFADMLLHLGMPYNSPGALRLAEKIMSRIDRVSHEASEKLVKERGVFPNWEGSIWQKRGKKIRNATTTTIAPTGTISMMASCSSGIEPIFSLVYTKTVIDGTPFVEANHCFEKIAKERGFYSKELMEKISEMRSIQNIAEIPDDVKKIFVTAADISPKDHVKMQAIFQKHTDNAISKTINFKKEASKKEVAQAYALAYRLGCKGITVYRDGSREKQIIKAGTAKSEEKSHPLEKLKMRKRPLVIHGSTYKIKTGYGSAFITVNEDEYGYPFEVFVHIGHAGGFFQAKAEAISRLISMSLRAGIDVHEVIEHLKGIRGPAPIWNESGMVLSLADGIAQTLQKHIESKNQQLPLDIKNSPVVLDIEDKIKINKNLNVNDRMYKNQSLADIGESPACPECGGVLYFGEGCMKCESCGYSKCS